MNREELRSGSIQKIVRVPQVPSPLDGRSQANDYLGYGIVRGSNGEEVFFVGSAVSDGDFAELQPGMEVTYVLEPGPLTRASQVRVAPKGERLSDYENERDFTVKLEEK